MARAHRQGPVLRLLFLRGRQLVLLQEERPHIHCLQDPCLVAITSQITINNTTNTLLPLINPTRARLTYSSSSSSCSFPRLSCAFTFIRLSAWHVVWMDWGTLIDFEILRIHASDIISSYRVAVVYWRGSHFLSSSWGEWVVANLSTLHWFAPSAALTAFIASFYLNILRLLVCTGPTRFGSHRKALTRYCDQCIRTFSDACALGLAIGHFVKANCSSICVPLIV